MQQEKWLSNLDFFTIKTKIINDQLFFKIQDLKNSVHNLRHRLSTKTENKMGNDKHFSESVLSNDEQNSRIFSFKFDKKLTKRNWNISPQIGGQKVG